MPYTLTITDNNPQALAFVQYAKKLDFVKVTKNKDFKEVVTPIRLWQCLKNLIRTLQGAGEKI